MMNIRSKASRAVLILILALTALVSAFQACSSYVRPELQVSSSFSSGPSEAGGDSTNPPQDTVPDGNSAPGGNSMPANGAYAGITVQGRHLIAPDGEKILLRGVNEMIIWTDPDGTKSLPNIAKTGANSVRIVWLSSGSPQVLDEVIQRALSYKLIPIVEMHDAVCKPLTSPEFSNGINYWLRSDVQAVMSKHQNKVLLNIANEAGDETKEDFAGIYVATIKRLRDAGYLMPLVVDTTWCGQNIQLSQTVYPTLLAADPLKRLVMSVHTYWIKDSFSDDWIRTELQQSVDMNMPLIIGEVSPYAWGCRPVNWQLILDEAKRLEIGWLAWSWGPGNMDCGAMDMTTNFVDLTNTGRDLVYNHPTGINATSVIPKFMQ